MPPRSLYILIALIFASFAVFLWITSSPGSDVNNSYQPSISQQQSTHVSYTKPRTQQPSTKQVVSNYNFTETSELLPHDIHSLRHVKCNEMTKEPGIELFSTFSMKSNFSEFVLHQNNRYILPYVRPETKKILCNTKVTFTELVCKNSNTVYQNQWCTSYDYPANILKLQNAYVDYGSAILRSVWNVFTQNTVYCLRHGIRLPPKGTRVPVKAFSKLAVLGSSTYISEFGHVSQEMLTKLIYTWITVPKGIPILWADGVGRKILKEFFDLGILDPNDHPVIYHSKKQRVYYSAKEMFLHHYPEHDGTVNLYMSPGTLLLTNKLLTSKFQNENPRNTILVLSRKDARSRRLSNHDQIVSAIKQRFGDRYEVVDIVPSGKKYFEVGQEFYHTRLVIAPHGAGLSHLLFMRCGTGVIEIGWYKGSWQMPIEYYCFARALGVKYGLVMAKGNYHTDLTPNIDETMEMVQDMLQKSSHCGSFD